MAIRRRRRGGGGGGTAVPLALPAAVSASGPFPAAEARVIRGLAAVVGEDVVGVLDLAEAARGFGAGGGVRGGVVVGVVAVRLAEEGVLDVGFAGVATDTQRLVVVGAHRAGRGQINAATHGGELPRDSRPLLPLQDMRLCWAGGS